MATNGKEKAEEETESNTKNEHWGLNSEEYTYYLVIFLLEMLNNEIKIKGDCFLVKLVNFYQKYRHPYFKR